MKEEFKDKVKRALIEASQEARAPDTPSGRRGFLLFFLATLSALALGGGAWGGYRYLTRPRGRILSPVEGTEVTRVFTVEGVTRNIPPERRFLWLASGIPGKDRCWPKRPVHKVNTPFEAEVLEQGEPGAFSLSLYSLDQELHGQFSRWVAIRETAGLEQPAGRYKLDSVYLLREFRA